MRPRGAGARTGMALPLAVVSLDSLAVAAWLRWLAAVAGGFRPPATATMLAVGGGAVMVGRGLLRLDPGRARSVAPLTAALAVVLVVRITLVPATPVTDLAWLGRYARDMYEGLAALGGASVATGVTLFVWWRGLRHATNDISSRQVGRTVATALAALAVLAATARFTYPVDLTPFVVAGSVAGLVAMAAARLAGAPRAGGWGPETDARWSLLVPAAVGLVLGLALVISAVVSLDLAAQVLDALRPVAEVLVRILLVGLVVLLDGLAALAAPLGRLLHFNAADWAAQFHRMQGQIVEQPRYDSEVVPGHTPPWVIALARFGVLAAAIGLAVVWLRRAAARYTRVDAAQGEVEREFALSGARIVDDAAGLARALVAGAAAAVGRLGRGEGQGARRAYRSFLAAMDAAGRARPPSATPFEFEAAGRRVVPEAQDAVAALTAAYVVVRYGGPSAGRDAARRGVAAWQVIRSALEGREARGG